MLINYSKINWTAERMPPLNLIRSTGALWDIQDGGVLWLRGFPPLCSVVFLQVQCIAFRPHDICLVWWWKAWWIRLYSCVVLGEFDPGVRLTSSHTDWVTPTVTEPVTPVQSRGTDWVWVWLWLKLTHWDRVSDGCELWCHSAARLIAFLQQIKKLCDNILLLAT